MTGPACISAAAYLALVAPKAKGRSKYGAVAAFRCEACGGEAKDRETPCPACRGIAILRFDSKAEARRYDQLRQRQKLGDISGLVRQERFQITVDGQAIGSWRADFSYTDRAGARHVEDVKGKDTDASRLRRRAVEAQYGITIEIVR